MQVIRPEIKRLIETLGDLPVDIRPEFVTAAGLPAGGSALSAGGQLPYNRPASGYRLWRSGTLGLG